MPGRGALPPAQAPASRHVLNSTERSQSTLISGMTTRKDDQEMKLASKETWFIVAALMVVSAPVTAWPHGDVNPQPVDTKGLKPLGDEWLKTNPYRADKQAISIGKSDE